MDTDTLLTLVASLLPAGVSVSEAELLDALIAANGDVSEAAGSFSSKYRSKNSHTNPKKRKRSGRLDSWLENSRNKSPDGPASSGEGSSSRRRYDTSPGNHPSPTKVTSPRKPISSGSGDKNGNAPSLLSLLKAPPPSPTKSLPRLPVLTLTTPTMVAQHTPTTLHTCILPAELACQLYYTMLEEAKTWSRNKWYLADRLVESPHTSGFYARDAKSVSSKGMLEAAQFWYNGNRQKPPRVFPDAMEEALHFVEKVVQEEMKERMRYPLEWGGVPSSWCANVAASNCYRGCKEGVGAHSDILTYLGPYPTIASISLGTTRNFRLREVIPVTEADQRQAQTFDIPLPHNSLLIMHPPTQEKFKHSIPTMKSIDTFRPAFGHGPRNEIDQHNERINITFRFFRPDFLPESIPRCKCTHGEIPAVLRSNMKKKGGNEASHFWMCNGGAQNEGKSCQFFKNLDIVGEGRGPCVNVKRGSEK